MSFTDRSCGPIGRSRSRRLVTTVGPEELARLGFQLRFASIKQDKKKLYVDCDQHSSIEASRCAYGAAGKQVFGDGASLVHGNSSSRVQRGVWFESCIER
ncbi:uncharacterized protein LOC143144984 isoform X1 [Ptiloglossa arizonensis]|uniref:uncharacterized protein LOC143144984 isoform X1 n=1 Tax=Ptiloglossa arizonensis TaxID=3350558 RepID=UPI003FA05F9C